MALTTGQPNFAKGAAKHGVAGSLNQQVALRTYGRYSSWRRGKAKTGRGQTPGQEKSWCGGKDSNLHGIATASPSSWCVCQFRHHRKNELPKYVIHCPAKRGKINRTLELFPL
jgi:hypothetical protein